MQEPNLFKIYTDILEKNKFNYFISGSVAAIVYGDPRLTYDIDMIISLDESDVDRFIKAFPSDDFYSPPKEIILEEIKKKEKGHLNIIHHNTGFKADIYLMGDDEFQGWGLENRQRLEFMGDTIYIAPVEYVIIKKLEFYKELQSPKHILDIKGILENSSDLINFEFLNSQFKRFELESIWKNELNRGNV